MGPGGGVRRPQWKVEVETGIPRRHSRTSRTRHRRTLFGPSPNRHGRFTWFRNLPPPTFAGRGTRSAEVGVTRGVPSSPRTHECYTRATPTERGPDGGVSRSHPGRSGRCECDEREVSKGQSRCRSRGFARRPGSCSGAPPVGTRSSASSRSNYSGCASHPSASSSCRR